MTAHTAPIDVYARVSRKSDDRQRSIAGQVADCKASLQDRGLPIGEVFIDKARSAWNPKVKRPDWERMMMRLEAGASGGVIVFDLERFARQPLDGERLIKQADQGAVILDIDTSYDLNTASGKKNFRDALSAAAYYSDRLSARVKRGKRVKTENGELNVAARPFGFLPGGIEPHPVEGPILQELVARLIDEENPESIRSLVEDLNNRGIKTARGYQWGRKTLRATLAKPTNAGLITYCGEEVGQLDGEPLISRKDYDRVLAVLASHRRGRPPGAQYLATGFLVCGRCDGEKHLHGRPSGKCYPDGTPRRQYWCGPSGCGRLFADQRAIDEAAGALAVKILSDPQNAETIAQAQAEHSAKAAKLDAEIATAEELGDAIAERFGRAELTPKQFDRANKPLIERLNRLRAEREKLNGLRTEPAPDASAKWQARWDAATIAQRRTLLRMALRERKIVVSPAYRRNADVSGRIRLS